MVCTDNHMRLTYMWATDTRFSCYVMLSMYIDVFFSWPTIRYYYYYYYCYYNWME